VNPGAYVGEIFVSLFGGFALSWMAAVVIARRYRTTMVRLMRENVPRAEAIATHKVPIEPVTAERARVTERDNLWAGRRLIALLVVVSLAIAATVTWLRMAIATPDLERTPFRVATLTVLYLWPIVIVFALVWRWSIGRVISAFLLWIVLAWAFLFARSVEPRPVELMLTICETTLVPFCFGLLLLTNRTRAIAPWLLIPLTALIGASFVGMHSFANAVTAQSPRMVGLARRLETLPDWVAVSAVLSAAVLIPAALAWWPLREFGRLLGRAYERKLLSELLLTFTAAWIIEIGELVVALLPRAGGRATLALASLLWIPLVFIPRAARPKRSRVRPPTLLVLRVFLRDQAVLELFDRVIERWRLSGNTLLIAGTDLVDRTLDARELFLFLDRRLASLFIYSAEDVGKRMSAFDLEPDADGRYRVNACYCHDTTWQPTLRSLAERSDVVLMDLRGFQSQNEGCRFELEVLASSSRELRIVALTDVATDRGVINQITGDRAHRFVWLDVDRLSRRTVESIMTSIFDAA
jgi:hypothetical protein